MEQTKRIKARIYYFLKYEYAHAQPEISLDTLASDVEAIVKDPNFEFSDLLKWQNPLDNSFLVGETSVVNLLELIATDFKKNYNDFWGLLKKISEDFDKAHECILYGMLNDIFQRKIWTKLNVDCLKYNFLEMARVFKKV
jgi:hypothetical protein